MKFELRSILRTPLLTTSVVLAAACSSETHSDAGNTGGSVAASGASVGGATSGAASGGAIAATGGMAQTSGAPGTGGQSGGASNAAGAGPLGGSTSSTGGQTGGGTATGGAAQNGGSGGAGRSGGAPSTGGTAQGGGPPATGGSAGKAGSDQSGGSAAAGGKQSGGTGGGGGIGSNCIGKAWPTADPTTMGSFQVAADKGVGPLAGALPDPVYGDTQQRFNVYRPKDLAQSGYCHPILVWANGHTDNPEPNPPNCVSSKYCGSYLMLMNQMASHGFVVIASLSTITSQGNPLPTIVGLDWLLQQSEEPSSPYYHRLDTAHIGAFGHSEGGFSTCKAASDPRISAISTVSGSSANPAFHQPALLFCGGKDTVVTCDSVSKTFSSITSQPAMLIDNLAADHGGWLYQNGAKGPDIFGMTAWFRYYLMGDMQQRKYFFGADCAFCTDTRVTVMRNALLTQ